LHGLSPNFHIHVSVSNLYIPTVHLFSCSRIGRSWENLLYCKSLRNMNIKSGTVAVQFFSWE
jgi:hypothetical protein